MVGDQDDRQEAKVQAVLGNGGDGTGHMVGGFGRLLGAGVELLAGGCHLSGL